MFKKKIINCVNFVQVETLKDKFLKLKAKCARSNQDAINAEIKTLPENQQGTVLACFSAAKVNKKGTRYTNQWIYECLLLRIKSPKAYEHLQRRNILKLPCASTLNRYLRAIKGSYGFDENLFKALKEKTSKMKADKLRGK